MADDAVVCGEWSNTPEGRWRKCVGNTTNPSPIERVTPAEPPAVKTAPGIERTPITQRTNDIARRLVELALGKDEEGICHE